MPVAVVIGGGVAATAIAHYLSLSGFAVELVFPGYKEGSSYTNQKWMHSGLLYPSPSLAKRAWEALQGGSTELDPYIMPSAVPATFFALHAETLKQREKWWHQWSIDDWGIPWRRLTAKDVSDIDVVRGAEPAGGFEVPDCVIDFPRLIWSMHRDLKQLGHRVTVGARVTRLLVDDRKNQVSGFEMSLGGKIVQQQCDLCVLAAGAWSKGILEQSSLAWPDFILRKCIVLIYNGELVPSITSCLDVRRHTGELKDVTLVPFRGRTLAAGTGYVEIDSMEDLDTDPFELDHLYGELYQAFPSLEGKSCEAQYCVKTEKRPGEKPNVAPQICGSETFGLDGLLLAIPGKASFMFDLARSVIGRDEVKNTT